MLQVWEFPTVPGPPIEIGQFFGGAKVGIAVPSPVPPDRRKPDFPVEVAGRPADAHLEHFPHRLRSQGAAERLQLHHGSGRGAAGVRLIP